MVFSKKWPLLLIGLPLLVLANCKTTKNETISVDALLLQHIATIGSTTYNTDKTYLLAVEELTADNEFIKFVVVNLETQKIVLEKKFRPGHVKWFDNVTIELLNTPGMIKVDENINDHIQYIKIPDQSTNQ